MDAFFQIMQAIQQTGERLTILEDAIARLEDMIASKYLPDPAAAEQERAMMPFDKSFRGEKRIPYDANAVPNYRGMEMYQSPACKTKGFTHHNCFVSLEVARDTVPDDLGDHLLFTAVLEGSAGSGFVELDQQQIFSTGRTGVFEIPLLSSDSLAIDTRFRLFAGDNATYPQPPPADPRLLKIRITGVLVSGYES